jgi:hypothetical protein
MIIAFTGYKGSGKDTAAKALKDFTVYKFADGLKAMLGSYLFLYGHSAEEVDYMLENPIGKELPTEALMGQTPRWAMQSLGTEWGRKLIHDDLWWSLMRKRLLLAKEQNKNVVITDLRFLNEAMLLYSLGGTVIRITRPNTVAGFHQSEKELDLIVPQYTIANNGTTEELLSKVSSILKV